MICICATCHHFSTCHSLLGRFRCLKVNIQSSAFSRSISAGTSKLTLFIIHTCKDFEIYIHVNTYVYTCVRVWVKRDLQILCHVSLSLSFFFNVYKFHELIHYQIQTKFVIN